MLVRPYVGQHYREAHLGLSILVLGESSYTKPENRGLPLGADWNERIISCVSRHEKDNTITRAAGVFFGSWRSWDQRCEFWPKVAFANFVQADMGSHGERPTDLEWEGGIMPFFSYLSDLQPTFVLALGSDLWRHLPKPDRRIDICCDGTSRQCYLYPNGNGWSLVLGIDHPASRRGWSYTKWTGWVLAAVEAAKKGQGGELLAPV